MVLLCFLPIPFLIICGWFYPFIRELAILYFTVEALNLLIKILCCKNLKLVNKNIVPQRENNSQRAALLYKEAWYLPGSRIFLLAMLLVLAFGRPSYFHANIIIAAAMAVLLFSALLNILAGRRKLCKVKKKKWVLPAAAAGFLLYITLGVLISGFRQPVISESFIQDFNVDYFYGEGEGTDRAVIIEDNKEALIERVRMIRLAEKRIILSTFDFRDDESGRIIIAALIEAADRGVDVKVVADGVSGLLRMGQNPYFIALSSHANAEVRIYNKINLLKPWALMGRLHDKYLIVDDMAYILGGRNTFSYFLGDTDGHINYDRDILVFNTAYDNTADRSGNAVNSNVINSNITSCILAGNNTADNNGLNNNSVYKASSLYQVEQYFQSIWEHKATARYYGSTTKDAKRISVKAAKEDLKVQYEMYLRKNPWVLETPDYTAMTFPIRQAVLLANPTGTGAKEPTVFYALTTLMENAKESVMIHTPYIICNDMMYNALARISQAVPEAGLMTNSAANNGNPFGAGDYQENFDKILATGIQLYEYEGGVSYHGKSIAIDNNISIIGSFNMDMRSVYLDTELMLVIDSEDITRQLKDIMEGYAAKSGRVLPDGSKIYLKGVTAQKMTAEKVLRVKVLYTLLKWARRLL